MKTKKAIPTLNVRLLRKVQKHILDEPKRLDMLQWEYRSTVAPCGTQACIAGWTTILAKKRVNKRDDYPRIAAKLLGLKFSANYGYLVDSDCDAGRLFLSCAWPEQFADAYDVSKSFRHNARVTSRRIDYFIKEGK